MNFPAVVGPIDTKDEALIFARVNPHHARIQAVLLPIRD